MILEIQAETQPYFYGRSGKCKKVFLNYDASTGDGGGTLTAAKLPILKYDRQ